jgi:hypothetical protein
MTVRYKPSKTKPSHQASRTKCACFCWSGDGAASMRAFTAVDFLLKNNMLVTLLKDETSLFTLAIIAKSICVQGVLKLKYHLNQWLSYQ